MKARWLSTFTILGLILVGLGIYGICKGTGFVFDPGQISDGKEAWYYLFIGLFMVVNGFFLPAPVPGDKSDEAAAAKPGETSGTPVSTARKADSVTAALDTSPGE